MGNVTDMSNMFYECKNFNQPLNNWNLEHVTDMSNMFYQCVKFNQSLDDWDVSNVRNMKRMFIGQGNNFNKPHWYN